MSLSKVIEIARGELGVTESPPGSNRVKYWEDYDPGYQGLPWCVCFLWWVFAKAGERMAFFGGGKTASCGTLLRWYKEQGLTVPEDQVQPGDIVILNFSGTRDTQHCGLVIEVVRYSSGKIANIVTVEGNTSTSVGSQGNGGMVCQKRRYPSQIVGVCRPQYYPDPVPVDDVSDHWAAEDIRWAETAQLMTGYPDGSFKPDQTLTRAEACVVMRRLYNLIIAGEDDLK